MSLTKRQLLSSYFNQLIDRAYNDEQIVDFDQKLPQEEVKENPQQQNNIPTQQNQEEEKKRLKKPAPQSLSQYKERKKKEREKVKKLNNPPPPPSPKQAEEPKVKKTEKQKVASKLAFLINGMEEEGEVKSVSSFHSDDTEKLKESPRKFMFGKMADIIDRQLNPKKYELEEQKKEEQERKKQEPKKKVVKKEEEVVKKQKKEKSKMKNNIFGLIDQGMNRKTYSLAEDFEDKNEGATQKERVSHVSEYKKEKNFQNRQKIVRTPVRQKTQEREKRREKKLFFEKEETNQQIVRQQYPKAKAESDKYKLPIINSKPTIEYKERSTNTILSSNHEPNSGFYEAVTLKNLRKVDPNDDSKKLYDDHQLKSIKISDRIMKYSLEEAAKKERFKYLKKQY